ncbi:FG-GAP repeat protein, partial [Ponticoccus sp. SC6-38]|nr:FG-GAP repeat protein [Ponticoccus sp. SC6-38]
MTEVTELVGTLLPVQADTSQAGARLDTAIIAHPPSVRKQWPGQTGAEPDPASAEPDGAEPQLSGDGWRAAVPQFPGATGETLRTIDTNGLDPALGFMITGAALNDEAGYSVGSAGDFNGDGIDDVIVGALNANGGTGAAYVIYGRAEATRGPIDLANLSPDDGFVLNGDQSNDKAGNKVAFAGDVNGDGIDDVIIGARNGDEGGNNAGTAYVIYGREGGSGDIDLGALTTEQGFAVIGATNFSQFGYNVSTAGDVNGDGIDDLIIGALGGATDGANAGDSYVIYGQTEARGLVDVTQLTESEGYLIRGIEAIRAGSVSGGGDINGDGIDDVIVGAHRGVTADLDAGEVYVVYGQAGTRGTLDLAAFSEEDGFLIVGDERKDYLGLSVAAAGDVNGDGFDDIIAGAFRGDDGGENAGEAYVIYGMAGPRGTVDLTGLAPEDGFIIQGDQAGDLAGLSVAAAGDINGDGIDDVIVGARYGDDGAIDAGEAYVIYGKTGDTRGTVDLTDLSASDGFIIQGTAEGDQAGRSVSAAGDVNGDGIDDLIVGAPAADGETGEAYVIYGFRNAPEATGDLPATVDAVAGEPLALDLSSLVITDVDATGDMRVTLVATGGTLAAGAGGGVAVALSDADQTLTLTGTLEALNSYLAMPGAVSFTGDTEAAPEEAITVTIDDLDGSGPVEVGVIGVGIANRAPDASGLPDAVEAVAGEPLALDLSSLVITDVDATGDMRVTLVATGGTL